MSLLAALRSALRALAANTLRSFLTMLGIIIGVAAVIAMIAVGQGATLRVQEQMKGLGSNILMVLRYKLMREFDHAVMRHKIHHTLSTLHHQVLAVEALWDDNAKNTKQTLRLAMPPKRRPWFEGLWASTGESVKLTLSPPNS